MSTTDRGRKPNRSSRSDSSSPSTPSRPRSKRVSKPVIQAAPTPVTCIACGDVIKNVTRARTLDHRVPKGLKGEGGQPSFLAKPAVFTDPTKRPSDERLVALLATVFRSKPGVDAICVGCGDMFEDMVSRLMVKPEFRGTVLDGVVAISPLKPFQQEETSQRRQPGPIQPRPPQNQKLEIKPAPKEGEKATFQTATSVARYITGRGLLEFSRRVQGEWCMTECIVHRHIPEHGNCAGSLDIRDEKTGTLKPGKRSEIAYPFCANCRDEIERCSEIRLGPTMHAVLVEQGRMRPEEPAPAQADEGEKEVETIAVTTEHAAAPKNRPSKAGTRRARRKHEDEVEEMETDADVRVMVIVNNQTKGIGVIENPPWSLVATCCMANQYGYRSTQSLQGSPYEQDRWYALPQFSGRVIRTAADAHGALAETGDTFRELIMRHVTDPHTRRDSFEWKDARTLTQTCPLHGPEMDALSRFRGFVVNLIDKYWPESWTGGRRSLTLGGVFTCTDSRCKTKGGKVRQLWDAVTGEPIHVDTDVNDEGELVLTDEAKEMIRQGICGACRKRKKAKAAEAAARASDRELRKREVAERAARKKSAPKEEGGKKKGKSDGKAKGKGKGGKAKDGKPSKSDKKK